MIVKRIIKTTRIIQQTRIEVKPTVQHILHGNFQEETKGSAFMLNYLKQPRRVFVGLKQPINYFYR